MIVKIFGPLAVLSLSASCVDSNRNDHRYNDNPAYRGLILGDLVENRPDYLRYYHDCGNSSWNADCSYSDSEGVLYIFYNGRISGIEFSYKSKSDSEAVKYIKKKLNLQDACHVYSGSCFYNNETELRVKRNDRGKIDRVGMYIAPSV